MILANSLENKSAGEAAYTTLPYFVSITKRGGETYYD